MKRQNVPSDRKFPKFFDGFFCHSVSVEQKMLVFFLIFHYLNKMFKKMFYQIDQRIVKLTNLTKNRILSNINLHGRGRPSNSDIFLVTAVANS